MNSNAMRRCACLLWTILLTGTLGYGVLWEDYDGELNGWKESPWFGWFWSEGVEAGWVNSWPHGWVWAQGPDEDNMWIWDYDLSWIWSSRGVHPFFYHAEEEKWLYYFVSSREPRWFYDEQVQAWVQVGTGAPASALTTPEENSGVAALTVPVMVDLSDGTYTEMPPLNTPVAITLARESTTFSFGETGLMTTGSTRALEIEVTRDLDPELVLPRIAIPVSELGTLDPETINIVRVEEVDNGDGTTSQVHSFLPVTHHADGTITACDYLMPDTIWAAQAALPANGATRGVRAFEGERAEATPYPSIRYIPCSFSGSLNYNRRGRLVRMIPDEDAPYKRVPYDSLSEEEKRWEDKKWIQNVIILVHGHNEEEKGGIYETSAEQPWLFAYKRDVWNLFYDELIYEWSFGTWDPPTMSDTTCVYEFIYPTYQGIFGELDEQFETRLLSEFSRQFSEETPMNLVIVAHSMGGLVARAAIQRFPSYFDRCLKKVITWGTPHMGSPLVSMRYVLGADLPYVFNIPGSSTLSGLLDSVTGETWGPVYVPVLKGLIRFGMSRLQMDAPGARDLRYVHRPPGESSYRLGLDQLFQLSSEQGKPENEAKYDLQDGTSIYNYNLQILNDNDRHKQDGTYIPIFGMTPKKVHLSKKSTFPWFTLSNVESETALGATVIPFLVADPNESVFLPFDAGTSIGRAEQSDGAVNLPSMVAHGVANYAWLLNYCDHEAYYGAPDSTGIYKELYKGSDTASRTIEMMYAGEPDPPEAYSREGLRSPPKVELGFGLETTIEADSSYSDGIFDIGYANEADFLMTMTFDPDDSLYENPYSILKLDGLSLRMYDGLSDSVTGIIPVEDVEINPTELPPYRASTEYPPFPDASHGPRLLKGRISIEDLNVLAEELYLLLEFKDGTELEWPQPVYLVNRSLQGEWELSLQLDNWGTGRDVIDCSLHDYPFELDESGMALVEHEDEGLDEWWSGTPLESQGWQNFHETTWIGSIQIEENYFILDVAVSDGETDIQCDWVEVEGEDKLQIVTETSLGMTEFHYEAYLTKWTDWGFLQFLDASEISQSVYTVDYEKTVVTGEKQTGHLSEHFEGEVEHWLSLDSPVEP